MKQVVYLLLVVNAVYFSWNLLSGSNEAARTLPPLPETAQRLVTLQEMQAAEVADIEAETKAKPPGTGIEASGIEVVTEAEPPGAGSEVAGVDAATTTEPPGAGSEVAGIDAATTSESPGAGVVPGCQRLGPFMSVADLQPLRQQLDENGLSPGQHTREEQTPVGYWVYLPAMEREAALEIRQMLDDASDSEYYIGKDNFISLGAFREISRAETRLKATRKLGLEPVLEQRFKTRTTHWLELDAVDEHRDSVEGILQGFPGVEMQAAACKSIAVTDTIQ